MPNVIRQPRQVMQAGFVPEALFSHNKAKFALLQGVKVKFPPFSFGFCAFWTLLWRYGSPLFLAVRL